MPSGHVRPADGRDGGDRKLARGGEQADPYRRRPALLSAFDEVALDARDIAAAPSSNARVRPTLGGAWDSRLDVMSGPPASARREAILARRRAAAHRRDPGLPLHDIMEGLAELALRPVPTVIARELEMIQGGLARPLSHTLYETGGVTVVVQFDDDAQRSAWRGIDGHTVHRAVSALATQLRRASAFFSRTLEVGGWDRKAATRKLLNICINFAWSFDGEWRPPTSASHARVEKLAFVNDPRLRDHANRSPRMITLGPNTLLNKLPAIVGREAFHLVATELLGKTSLASHRTPLAEALADYFGAVIADDPDIGDPLLRRVDEGLKVQDVVSADIGEPGERTGAWTSGLLWQVRDRIRHVLPRAVTDFDAVVLRAYADFPEDKPLAQPGDLTEWVEALLNANREARGSFGRLTRAVAAERGVKA
jgi:hypothetical protein